MLKGVNLGGWLVLERWITPSLFDGLEAKDENTFCLELGESKTERLQKHHKEFITEDDFKWLAQRGINAVRIPLPHWIFGDTEPYMGGIATLDWALDAAKKCSLKVLLDIHTAPGSQNGYKHSGLEGAVTWHKDDSNIVQSLDFIKRLSDRYKAKDNLWGIELLNEPQSLIPRRILEDYYKKGYKIIRETCGKKLVVVISDSFQLEAWQDFMSGSQYKNVITDTHLYQCFSRHDKKLNLKGHLAKTDVEWSTLISTMQRHKPVIIGEWSLGLPDKAFNGMDEHQKKEGLKAFADAQLNAFNGSGGWFIWTYKTEGQSGWNFRHCVETGLLPDSF